MGRPTPEAALTAPTSSPVELADQLTALGVRPGAVIMVHASLRAIGPVAGRAGGVIEALRLAVGVEGSILMMIAADDRRPFDRLTTPADPENGVLAEVFRTTQGVSVNDHPACRLAALGPAASTLLEPQPRDDYYGGGSPLERFVAIGGQVLRLGADIDTVTLTHHAENLARLTGKRRKRRRYLRADETEWFVDSIDDSGGIADWPHGDYFPQILLDFVAAGRDISVGQVGATTAERLDARAFTRFAIDWLERELST